jgi:flagellar P-ring protein precursor FlgI
MTNTIKATNHTRIAGMSARLTRACATALAVIFVGGSLSTAALSASRIKDIADFEGIRDNLLVGYGLVVGLNGTGDSLSKAPFTKQSLESMLERLGVNTRDANLNTNNVAAVMVSANLPAFSKQGSRIDITVSTLGDSESLLGGTLLATPLMGADGEVYAVAQGGIAVGGFSAAGAATSVTKGVPTSGRIPAGAIIEREVPFNFSGMKDIDISLRNPDVTTALRVSDAINAFLGGKHAKAINPNTIHVVVPKSFRNDMIGMLTKIEQLRVEPDMIAKVVVDEQTGIIVMGDQVRVSTVAIAQGNLTIRVTETPQVSQPGAFSEGGETTTVDRSEVEITENGNDKLTVLNAGVSLEQLVNGLNALGIGPRDMISILQTIKAAGALQAKIVTM